MKKQRTILGLALVSTGLSAGLFFAFSTAINPAFSKLSDRAYIDAMQNINKYIQNPVFFLVFFGAMVLLPLSAYYYRHTLNRFGFKLLMAASLLYVVGTIGVTCAANVPLNDKLAKLDTGSMSASQLASERADYVKPWNAWHTVRTVSAVAALAAGVGAAISLSATRNEEK